MKKTAFIFPGQGAQFTGMGEDFYKTYKESKEIYDSASDLICLDMKKLCFEEKEKLNITEYTQAAILTTCIAILKAMKPYDISPDVCAGLSLGEYAALVACETMTFSDAVKVVRQRGILMQQAVPIGLGAMAAILALDKEKVEEVCSEIEGVQIANYNCPGQIVISGKKEAVEKTCVRLKEVGAKRTVLLNVSGPFHSVMLKEAGEKLKEVLKPISFKEHYIPYVTNVTAEYIKDTKQIKELLTKQVYSSVRWQQSIENMIQNGVETFIEIGPGKTLTAFVKKINKDVKVINIETVKDLEKLKEM